jgi:diguanylate cyclase (GGDEF)-like protein/PAS domain S-box-containing protein
MRATAGALNFLEAVGRLGIGTKQGLESSRCIGCVALSVVRCFGIVGAGGAALWLLASGAIVGSAVDLWRIGWLGDSAGALVLGVPLLATNRTNARAKFRDGNWPIALALAVGAAATTYLVFFHSGSISGSFATLSCVPHLLIAVLTLRSGLFAGAFSASLAFIGALVGVQTGSPASPGGGLLGASIGLWVYAVTLAAVPLVVAAVQHQLWVRKQQWRLSHEASGLGVAEWDLRRDQVELSPYWLEMLGYKVQSFGTSPDSFWARFHPEDLSAAKTAFERMRGPVASPCRFECRLLAQDGCWLPMELNVIVAGRGLHGTPHKLICTARDVSEQFAAREERTLSQSLFRHLHEGLLVTDARHRVVDANPMYSEITGYSRDETLGTVPAMLRLAHHGRVESDQQLSMRASLEATGAWHGEIFHRRSNGEPCTLQITASVVNNKAGAVQNHILAITDITQARLQIEQLRRQAHYDELTGLPNRVKLTQILMESLATSEREGSLLTICFLDLDYFKPINDQFGHHMGDQLLVKLAERLRRALRTRASGDDVIARIGGDEFVLLLRTATLEESRQAVERMLRQVHQPFGLDDSELPVYITASIGATVFPLDQADAETLLRHADHAMYGAKQAGRNGYQFFDAEHDRRTEARFVALGRVQEALDAEELCLYFQPKVDMRDGQVIGVEALLRWKHPEQGLLLPAQFLPLIEHTGLAVSVGNWVLQKGIEQLAQWQMMGLDLTVSINVSARHLQEPMFASHLAMLLSQQATPVADRLVIEILETTALADVDFTCDLMQECRALGVRFALDDFGTGYSTLTYLKRLPLDMLKIDRSFVINMLNDRHDLAIVEGVIGLSETFGCTVVAEGVDTLEQAQRLIEIGCDIGQGNGIAPAMPAEEVIGWVHSFSGISTLAAPLID